MSSIRCLHYLDGAAHPLPLEQLSRTLASGFTLAILRDPDTRTLARLGDQLGLHELALEDAETTHQRPKLESYGDHLFISAKTAELWEARIHFSETHCFVGAHFLAVVCHGSRLGFERLEAALAARPNSGYALYLLLDLFTDEMQDRVNAFHDQFLGLEASLLGGDADRTIIKRLYRLKQELGELRLAAEPMQAIVQDLLRLHPDYASRELRDYYRDVHDHALRVTAAIDSLRASASDAMQFHLATLTVRQNESVQKLAGWGALLAIPTVVFSLYGMNFEVMPELRWRWGYPAVVLLTAGAAFWLYKRLKRRGWI